MNDTTGKPQVTRASSSLAADKLGASLRQLYDEVATEPVPDEFLRLLEKADTALQSTAKDVDAAPPQAGEEAT